MSSRRAETDPYPTIDAAGAPIAKFCLKCAGPLDVKTAVEIDRARMEADEMMNKLLEDPEVKGLLEQKIRQLKLA